MNQLDCQFIREPDIAAKSPAAGRVVAALMSIWYKSAFLVKIRNF
jgi:hypothetical protein